MKPGSRSGVLKDLIYTFLKLLELSNIILYQGYVISNVKINLDQIISCIILIYIFDILYPSNVSLYAESSLFSDSVLEQNC